jgi:uncharacterized protein (DUF983 family)
MEKAITAKWRYAPLLKCPTCGKGDLFKANPYVLSKVLDMNDKCAYCGEDFQVETGFYHGAMYMSYIITSAMCLFLLPIYTALNFSRDKFLDNAIYYISSCAIMLVVAAPYVTQFSRAVWLTIHVKWLKKHH